MSVAIANSWTRCADELPDSDTTVLIYSPSPDASEPVWLGYHDGTVWRDIDNIPFAVSGVTHWMHLPEPPPA